MMNRTTGRFLIALLAATGIGSARAEVVGRAGSIQLDDADVRALLATLPESSRAAVGKDRASLEKIVRAELVRRATAAEARAAGFDHSPETQAALARAQGDLLVQLWLASKAQVPADYPKDADITTAYEQNRAALQGPAEYHLAQIFINAPDAADAATLAKAVRKVGELAPKLAAAGASFGQLARDASEQADSASKDGDMGWLAETQLLPVFASAVHQLKVGEISGPIKTSQGFHFLKLLETRPGKPLEAAEARERIRSALRERRARELQQAYLEALNARLAVSVNEIALQNLASGVK